MMRAGVIFAAFALSACATDGGTARPFGDPAVQALFEQPVPNYFATTKIASQLAQNCARYSYDAVLDAALNERRNEVGRGSLSAVALRGAIELETDVSQRSFSAKHGVDLAVDDLCPAADAEYEANSAIAAMLVPV